MRRSFYAFLCVLALVGGSIAALAVCGGCAAPTPYVVPPAPPVPPDPWVPPVPPDPVDPVVPPVVGGLDRALFDAVPDGASTQEVTAALGEPARVSVVDGLTVWVYPLAEPSGAVGEVRFDDGVVVQKSVW